MTYPAPFVNSFSNYSSQQCLALPTPEQVDCSGQHVNISDPPSIWGGQSYSVLWQPVSCYLWNVTLNNRVDMEGEGSAQEFYFESLADFDNSISPLSLSLPLVYFFPQIA